MKCSPTLALLAVVLVGMSAGQGPGVAAETPWLIERSQASWTQSQASGDNIAITNALSLKGDTGQWTSQWHPWQGTVDAADVAVKAAVAQFTQDRSSEGLTTITGNVKTGTR